MINFEILDNKSFMNSLLKSSVFDKFEARSIKLCTFTTFEISCILEKSYFSIEQQNSITNKFCLWEDVRPVVFQLIKGSKLPKYIKIILSYDTCKITEISENAASLFLNINFEGNKINCYTGSSEKIFTLKKEVENNWDLYIKEFFNNNGLNV